LEFPLTELPPQTIVDRLADRLMDGCQVDGKLDVTARGKGV
jgi:hypothetical protein